jgi:gamma-glutamyltranspeptidase/glutathione hydrolase
MMHNAPRILLAVSLVLVLAFGARTDTRAYDRPEGSSGFTPKTLAKAKRHMVVAANPLAAEAGLAILRKGGSAVDAAIAVQMVLNVVEPQSSGLGGGAFLLTWDQATKTLLNIDGREAAPNAATPELFLDAAGRRCPKQAAESGRSGRGPRRARRAEACA